MKYRAVIFDLYGTLVDELWYPYRQEVTYQRMVSEIAATLRVRIEDFRRVWSDTSHRQNLGELKPTIATLTYLCGVLNVEVSNEQLEHAAAIRLEHMRRSLKPRDGALETLARLRDADLKTGLISNCISDTSDLWPSTPFVSLFDMVVFSCDVGMKKPDLRIYTLGCDCLGVEPGDCLFIGDGSSGELTGATSVGMDAVLIRAPDDTENGDREDWQGTRISSVEEVLGLVV